MDISIDQFRQFDLYMSSDWQSALTIRGADRSEEVAEEELDLVRHDRLVRRAVVDVEVVDAGIGAQLSEWGTAGGGDRRAGLGDAVGLADADQPWAMQLPRVPGGSVRPPEQPARGDPVAPARVL